MKAMYYHPQKVSTRSFVIIAVVSVIVIAAVEFTPQPVSLSRRDLMTKAATATDAGFQAIRKRRIESGIPMLSIHDPAATGMLGPSMSQVTSLPGHLDAKQTSVNPNFAAVVVQYLLAAGAQPGDEIAIGCTGSFPALNLAVLTAAESMGLKPSLISSVASSQFGANHPQLMWPDMERILHDEGIIHTRSLAISRGGFRDMAVGMTEESRNLLDACIERSGRLMLENEEGEDFIEKRMRIYAASSGDIGRYAAYVNVGGGMASIGGTKGNDQLGHGVIRPSTFARFHQPIDSVAARFLANDVPVINMVDVVAMAREHGLPVAPTTHPMVGEGDVYREQPLRKPFALAGIGIILAMTTLLVRPPVWVSRHRRWFGQSESINSEARWMV